MSQYDLLARLRDLELDEKRRAVAKIQGLIDALIAKREALEEEVLREQKIASSSIEASINYNAFANSVILRKEKINSEIHKLQEENANANEEMLMSFQELRKAEIIRDDFNARERQKEARLEQIELDEIAQNLYQRNRR